MNLPKSINTITSFSKFLALFLLLLFPLVGFYSGIKYQQKINLVSSTNQLQIPVSPNEAIPDLEFYFTHIEQYSPNLPNYFETKAIIRGRLIEKEVQPVCMVGPCPSYILRFLQDVHSPSIMVSCENKLTKKLTLNRIYTLKGLLGKTLDNGKKPFP